MPEEPPNLSTDADLLATIVSKSKRLLFIQDLDGVCMGLVRDPRTRSLERRYLDAASQLAPDFRVLTNGEHDGQRGVNAIVEAAYGGVAIPRSEGRYLPGLAAGGVQLQDRYGVVSHPGVSRHEIRFLGQVPARTGNMLRERLLHQRFRVLWPELETLVSACVLNNNVSPTLNLNTLHTRLEQYPELYRELQKAAREILEAELARARDEGLDGAFFIHLAPNQGRDDAGRERLRLAQGRDAGTTDFQFMLRGAVKEAGVLVLLNHYYREHYGISPLGENFSVREAPADENALIELAARHFEGERMPRIVAVGDTVTSYRGAAGIDRGGSDRGFLQLVQRLGEHFAADNLTVFVDSSGGEVRRPGIRRPLANMGQPDWSALEGISDEGDPLRINFLFPGGHGSYVEFFCELAMRRSAHS